MNNISPIKGSIGKKIEAKYPEITLGETICEKLKNIYFSNLHWQSCYQNVASKFTELKKKARKFYSDRTDLEILKELQRYSNEDIKDLMES